MDECKFVQPAVLQAFQVLIEYIFVGKRRYNMKTWKLFSDTFNCMPPVGMVSERILCMHGGIVRIYRSKDQGEFRR
jgi:hypothetical protein